MKTKKQYNKTLIVGILLIVFIAVFSAVMVFLLFVNNSLQKMQSDVYNVKQAVAVQQKNNWQVMQEQLQTVISNTQEKSASAGFHYVNDSWGLAFDFPLEQGQKFQLREIDNMVMFGVADSVNDQDFPRFTVRYLPQTTIEDYQDQVRFQGEECLAGEKCLMFDFAFESLDKDRKSALNKIFEKDQVNDLNFWKVLLNQDCVTPILLIYNENNQALIEFQENCLSGSEAGFESLMGIVRSLSFVKK